MSTPVGPVEEQYALVTKSGLCSIRGVLVLKKYF